MTLMNGTSKGLFPSHNPHDNVFTSQFCTNNLSHFLIFLRFILVRKRRTRGAFFLCGLATRPILAHCAELDARLPSRPWENRGAGTRSHKEARQLPASPHVTPVATAAATPTSPQIRSRFSTEGAKSEQLNSISNSGSL